MYEKGVENGRTETRTDSRTDGRTDGHHHTIIRPVWRRAYKKKTNKRRKIQMPSAASPYTSHLSMTGRAPDNFWVQCVFTPIFIQCWFSNFQMVFSSPPPPPPPLILFRNAEKGRYNGFEAQYLHYLCVVLFINLAYCLWYYIANMCFCNNTSHNTKETIGKRTDRRAFLLLFFKLTSSALLRTAFVT